jgi:hypothetical protein
MDNALEQAYPRPLSGHTVAVAPPAHIPARAPIIGRHVRLDPLEPAKHVALLYAASHGSAEALRIWDFLPYGPFPDEAAFTAWLTKRDIRARVARLPTERDRHR